MNKSIFIIIFLLTITPVFASNFTLSIQPNFGFQLPHSTLLKDYYDRDNVFNYGATAILKYKKLNIGLFIIYSRYNFFAEDKFGKEEINGSWLSFGIQKDIRLKKNIIYGRLGITKHFDNLDHNLDNSKRIGINAGLGFVYKLPYNIGVFIETSYEYEKISVPMYLPQVYLRDYKYLAGKTFETGGILIQSGISIPLIK